MLFRSLTGVEMDENLFNAFIYAIKTNDSEVFDCLAKKIEQFDDKDKKLVLFKLVQYSPDVNFIKSIIEKYGFDYNFVDEGTSLLHLAVLSNNLDTVKFFIEKGLDIEQKIELTMQTPFLLAAEVTNNPAILQFLMDAGADINARDKNGENALISAAGRNPCLEVTKFLLSLGFDTEERDSEGFTPTLNAARWQENVDVLIELVKAGASTTVVTNNGETMFHLSAMNEFSAMTDYIKTLFSTSQTDNAGVTCLENALMHARNPVVLNYYLQKMKEEHMMLACSNDNPEIIETLIIAGYSANTTDCDGKTALMFAAKNNTNIDVIKVLRFYNAIWDNSDNKGRTALHYAAVNSDPAIYNWMMEDSNFKTLASRVDKAGQTPEYYLGHKEDF